MPPPQADSTLATMTVTLRGILRTRVPLVCLFIISLEMNFQAPAIRVGNGALPCARSGFETDGLTCFRQPAVWLDSSAVNKLSNQ